MNQAEIKRRQAEAFSTILTLITMAVVARVTGENGVAYIVTALEIFGLVWILISGNVSDTLGRLLRIRNAKGQYKNVLKMRRNVMLVQVVLGLLGSLLLLIFAGELAEGLFQMQYSTFILMVLAPTIFLRTVSSVFLGYFQGEGSELPSAVSGILRQIFILGFGLLFGKMLGNYGSKVSNLLLQSNFTSMYGGVGIAIAVSLTEGFIVIFLFLIYKGTRRPKANLREDGMRFTDSFFDSIRIFFVSRGVQLGIQLLAFLPLPLGLLFLQKAVENADEAAAEYGAYLSGYVVVCGVLLSLLFMVMLPIAGRILICLRKEEQRYAKSLFQSGTHIIIVYGAFWAICLTALASQTAAVVSPGAAASVGKMFAAGASAIPFLALGLYFGRLLVLSGRKVLVMGALAVADIIYVVSVTVFLNAGKMGALALVCGGMLGAGVLCVLLGILACRQLRSRFDWLQVLILPAGAACVSGLVVMLVAKLSTPHLGNLITILVTLALGGVVYWILLLVLRNFKEQELEAVPGGRILNALGQMLRVF